MPLLWLVPVKVDYVLNVKFSTVHNAHLRILLQNKLQIQYSRPIGNHV